MKLRGSLEMFCVLIFACTGDIVVSAPNSTNVHESDQTKTQTTVQMNTTSVNTKENLSQKLVLNTTLNESSLNAHTTLVPVRKLLNNSSQEIITNQSNANQTNNTEIIQATNSSNFYYSIAPEDETSNASQIDTEVEDLMKMPPKMDNDSLQDTDKPIIFLYDNSVNMPDVEDDDDLDEVDNKQPKNRQHPGIVPGKVAVILAAVFVAFAVVGYVALLSWRRYLENRYANREMLVEDDYCEKQMNDLEHFSI